MDEIIIKGGNEVHALNELSRLWGGVVFNQNDQRSVQFDNDYGIGILNCSASQVGLSYFGFDVYLSRKTRIEIDTSPLQHIYFIYGCKGAASLDFGNGELMVGYDYQPILSDSSTVIKITLDEIIHTWICMIRMVDNRCETQNGLQNGQIFENPYGLLTGVDQKTQSWESPLSKLIRASPDIGSGLSVALAQKNAPSPSLSNPS